jgi:hypothetical protein
MANEVKHPEEKNSTTHLTHDGAEHFWVKNSKMILIALSAVILLVAGYLIYESQFKPLKSLKRLMQCGRLKIITGKIRPASH